MSWPAFRFPADRDRRARGALVIALLVAMAGSPRASWAQRASESANVGRLRGLVSDTLGVPLRNVTVLLAAYRRTTRTRDDGTFEFDSVPAGRVRVNARAIGYIAAGVDTLVTRGDTTRVELHMLQLAASLPTMTSTAERAGLAGVVGDTTYRAIEGVVVRTLGRSHRTTTDSVGGFYLPLPPGPYMLRLDRDGFAPQTFGVHIPEDSGKRVAIWMTPAGALDATEVMRQMNLFELEQRLVRARPVRYRTFSREALQRFGSPDLMQTMARATAQRVNPDACAAINGGPVVTPLWSIDLDEVEFVEANLYAVTSAAGSRGPTSISGMRARPSLPSGTELAGRAGGCPYVVWMRR